jgi:HK97 family phage prohead protease
MLGRSDERKMKKVFNLISTFKAVKVEDSNSGDSITIRGLASTNSVDRAGDVILQTAWLKGLDNYKKNPIILFNHNYDQPIGKAADIRVTDKGLELVAKISAAADDVYQLVKEGILCTFSVGFMIKDAEYNEATDGFIIKDAELYEVSVVSVPCNQDATFSLSKSFGSTEEYENYKSVYLAGHSLTAKEVKISRKVSDTLSGAKNASMEKINMNPEEIQALVEKVAKDTAAKIQMQAAEAKSKEAAETKAAAEKSAADKASATAIATAVSAGMTSGAERLYADMEAKMAAREADVSRILDEKMADLKSNAEELSKMAASKRTFGDRQSGDWTTNKTLVAEAEDAVILGLATQKGLTGTRLGQQLMEKAVNAMSGIVVSSANIETLVSSNVERDIQNALVLAPLFREIALTSANQIIPILPDSGYAEITGNVAASGSSPNGNLETRGAAYGTPFGGVTMTEVTLSTVKLISQSYLGNETEEDAIIPILPLIRESIVRSHARGVEQAFLLGNHSSGVYTSGAFNGLVQLASTSSRNLQSSTAFASESLTGAQLLTARKNMGKYGVRPDEVVYVVSQRAYYELLQDSAFADWNQVQNMATKMTGEVGMIYGSKVLLCDEFATAAVSTHYAVAINTRNFVVPRLRGMRMESQYLVANQNTVITASQRIGFKELISGATAVTSLQYKAS